MVPGVHQLGVGLEFAGGMQQTNLARRGRRIALCIGLIIGLSACNGNSTETVDRSVAEPSVAASSAESTTAQSAATTSDTTSDTTSNGSETTVAAEIVRSVLNVPGDSATVQGAVDMAKPGAVILIAPGVYKESVVVRTPNLVLRGLDRNKVIFDGEDQRENGILVAANNVAIENLSVTRFVVNGLLFTKAYDDQSDDPTQRTYLDGYRASFITSTNNGLYGIYAFFARNGLIEESYVSGHPDGGVYIGQCKPCDAVVRNVIGEHNAFGYLGTNAGGNLYVINSTWKNNRVGIAVNSQDMELLTPQEAGIFAGNLVVDNNDSNAPATPDGAFGFGIAVGGGTKNKIMLNRVTGNNSAGIVVTDMGAYLPKDNEVTKNVLEGNSTDLAYYSASAASPLDLAGNCFAENTFASSLPKSIDVAMTCPAVTGSIASGALSVRPAPPNADYRNVPLPPNQPNKPDQPTDVVDPIGMPTVDLATIVVPKR